MVNFKSVDALFRYKVGGETRIIRGFGVKIPSREKVQLGSWTYNDAQIHMGIPSEVLSFLVDTVLNMGGASSDGDSAGCAVPYFDVDAVRDWVLDIDRLRVEVKEPAFTEAVKPFLRDKKVTFENVAAAILGRLGQGNFLFFDPDIYIKQSRNGDEVISVQFPGSPVSFSHTQEITLNERSKALNSMTGSLYKNIIRFFGADHELTRQFKQLFEDAQKSQRLEDIISLIELVFGFINKNGKSNLIKQIFEEHSGIIDLLNTFINSDEIDFSVINLPKKIYAKDDLLFSSPFDMADYEKAHGEFLDAINKVEGDGAKFWEILQFAQKFLYVLGVRIYQDQSQDPISEFIKGTMIDKDGISYAAYLGGSEVTVSLKSLLGEGLEIAIGCYLRRIYGGELERLENFRGLSPEEMERLLVGILERNRFRDIVCEALNHKD